jgi:hypothetical protein
MSVRRGRGIDEVCLFMARARGRGIGTYSNVNI